jgi:hypothetical protein
VVTDKRNGKIAKVSLDKACSAIIYYALLTQSVFAYLVSGKVLNFFGFVLLFGGGANFHATV